MMNLDPSLIVLAAVCARGITRLIEALAQLVVLEARARLIKIAVSAPVDVEIIEKEKKGTQWQIRTGSTSEHTFP